MKQRIPLILFRYLLSIILSIVLSDALCCAVESPTMIRYDRIWECIDYQNAYDYVKYMRFDGTEEINGKTYHRLITFKKVVPIYDFTEKCHHYDKVFDNICEHEGFLREEAGIVYTLAAKENREGSESHYEGYVGRHYVPNDDWDGNKNWEISEVPIYNFNCQPGETLKIVTFTGPGSYGGLGFYTDVTVMEKTYREIDGESNVEIEVYWPTVREDETWYFPHTFIEGIGATSDGCLNYHEFADKPTCLWYHNCLNRVYNTNGELIFESPKGVIYSDLLFEGLGIDEIKESQPSSKKYDIFGREIRQPMPGQIYIQGGRKYIGPVR